MRAAQQTFDDAHGVKCDLAGEVLRSSGRLRLRVMGWSMLPTVWPGDMLVVDSVKSDDVCEGDIVLFGRDRRLFAHRVVKNNAGGNAKIVTRGDAMPAPDPPVDETQLLGKVSCIVRNGRCIEPRRNLRLSERAVAALVRGSDTAARVVVGIHGMRQTSQLQSSQNEI